MRKIGKKLSYLLKVFMASGLLFVNVSSISVVFAAEDLEPANEETENVEFNEETTSEEDDKQVESDDPKTEDGENSQESTEIVDENDETQGSLNNETSEDDQNAVEENNNQEEVTNVGSETTTGDEEVTPGDSQEEVLVYGDINKDETVNEDDLNLLMEQIVGSKEIEDTKASDLNEDGTVDTLDSVVLYDYLKYLGVIHETRRIIPDEYYEEEYEPFVGIDDETKIPSKMDGDVDGLENGSTFTLQYIITLSDLWINGIDGLIDYDKTKLELSDVTMNYFDSYGADNDGRFLYIGDYIVTLPETDEEGNYTDVIPDTDYVIVTMTFKALQTGTSTVSVEDVVYILDDMVFMGSDGSSIDITVDVSSDNTLKSLTVAGQEIALSDDTLNYTINVSNDTTAADVVAILNNDNAEITSIVSPAELEVGENTITVTVTAENGDVRIYTITVIKEGTTNNNNNNTAVPTTINYQNNDTANETTINVDEDDDDKKIDNDKKKDDKKEEKTKEKGNLSRIIIIILILLVIAGLIFLIFKDDDDDDEEKKNNTNSSKKTNTNDSKRTSNNENKKKQKK